MLCCNIFWLSNRLNDFFHQSKHHERDCCGADTPYCLSTNQANHLTFECNGEGSNERKRFHEWSGQRQLSHQQGTKFTWSEMCMLTSRDQYGERKSRTILVVLTWCLPGRGSYRFLMNHTSSEDYVIMPPRKTSKLLNVYHHSRSLINVLFSLHFSFSLLTFLFSWSFSWD